MVLTLGFALPPLLSAPSEVARMSAAMFTISYSEGLIVSVLSGAASDSVRQSALRLPAHRGERAAASLRSRSPAISSQAWGFRVANVIRIETTDRTQSETQWPTSS